MKNSKQLLFERMHSIGGMPINEGVGDELSKQGVIKPMNEIKAGDVFEKRDRVGDVTRYVAMGSLKQSPSNKNEYYIPATALSSTGNFYKRMEEYQVTTNVKLGNVGSVKYLGDHRILRKKYPDL